MPDNHNDDQPAGLKKAALIAAIMGLSAWAMDVAATQVALPTIQTALSMSVTESQWVLNIAIMMLAAMVTQGGWLGDHYGRVRIFRLGFIFLSLGSIGVIVCGLTDQVALFYAGRAIEGIGAGLLIPASTALLIDVFSLEERGKAMGNVFGGSMAAVLAGPIIAGVIIQDVGWVWVYLLPLAFAVIGIASLAKVKYTQTMPKKTEIDSIGSVLLFVTIVLLIYGFLEAGALGWTNPLILTSIAGGIILGAILLLVEGKKKDPLLHIQVMKIRNVSIGLFISLMRFLPNIVLTLFLVLYVQEVLHFSPVMAGFATIPFILATMFTAGWAGKLFDRKGPRIPIPVSILMFAVSMVIAGIGFALGNYWVLAAALVIGGMGMAFSNTVSTASLNATPLPQRGMVAGLMPLSSQFGTAIWIALITSMQVTIVGMLTSGSSAVSFEAAMSQALLVISWIVALIMVITFFISLKLEG